MFSGWLRRSLIRAACGAVAVATTGAHAQPNYDFRWATIGDPGNRGTTKDEAPRFYPPFGPGLHIGAVGYEYRMATTEVTTNQWIDFLDVYREYFDGPLNDFEFTDSNVFYSFSTDSFRIISGFEQAANPVSWRMAARYVNWLHNGKRTDRAAFESGAYDTRTFTFNADNTFNDQLTRSPGAKFWIPSLHEWVKGMYWDPAKNNGEGGYWLYPTGSDTPPIYASPEAGGQSNAGTFMPMAVGSYPHVMSPWGLLDGSGGERELTELHGGNFVRIVTGSSFNSGSPEFADRIDTMGSAFPQGVGGALRIASVVPAPAPASMLIAGSMLAFGRRRRSPCAASPSRS